MSRRALDGEEGGPGPRARRRADGLRNPFPAVTGALHPRAGGPCAAHPPRRLVPGPPRLPRGSRRAPPRLRRCVPAWFRRRVRRAPRYRRALLPPFARARLRPAPDFGASRRALLGFRDAPFGLFQTCRGLGCIVMRLTDQILGLGQAFFCGGCASQCILQALRLPGDGLFPSPSAAFRSRADGSRWRRLRRAAIRSVGPAFAVGRNPTVLRASARARPASSPNSSSVRARSARARSVLARS